MIDLSDLGLAPARSAATDAPSLVAPNDSLGTKGLVPGSMLARVLYAAFSRQPVTIVDSPPGAGKTALLVDALEQLLRRSDFIIAVACPTRRGAADLAGRLASMLGDAPGAAAVLFSVKGAPQPTGSFPQRPPDRKRSVAVRTLASCAYSPPACDILFIDEAYQATFAQVAAAADAADQVVMVGDPGQIGPVVTTNTATWERMDQAPHRRAPEVFARRDDAMVLQMDATYRLGQPTVDAISTLYGFEFTSKRPDRHLLDPTGRRLPELAAARIDPAESVTDLAPMKQVASIAASMVGCSVSTPGDHPGCADSAVQGSPVAVKGQVEHEVMPLRAEDVAVVVSHNVQASGVQAILRAEGYDGITVGTADRMQGGQWHAVVVLDPLVGHAAVSPHQLNPGRLCVMASRHLTSLTWVSDGQEITKLTTFADPTVDPVASPDAGPEADPEAVVRSADSGAPEASVGIAVRRHLLAGLPTAS